MTIESCTACKKNQQQRNKKEEETNKSKKGTKTKSNKYLGMILLPLKEKYDALALGGDVPTYLDKGFMFVVLNKKKTSCLNRQ